MNVDARIKYGALMRRFLGGELPAQDFALAYIDAFKAETSLLGDDVFLVLDRLFGDADAYTSDIELLAEKPDYFIDEATLRTRVRRTLEALGV